MLSRTELARPVMGTIFLVVRLRHQGIYGIQKPKGPVRALLRARGFLNPVDSIGRGCLTCLEFGKNDRHVCHQKKIVIERTRDLIYLKFVATDFSPKIISPSAGENSGDSA